jgi:hypothetical protein
VDPQLLAPIEILRRAERFNPLVWFAYTGRPTHPAVQHGYWWRIEGYYEGFDEGSVRTSVQNQE